MGGNGVRRENYEIRAESRNILQGNWGMGVAIILVTGIITGIGGSSSGPSWRFTGQSDWHALLTAGAIVFGIMSVAYTILVANVVRYGLSVSYLHMGRERRLVFDSLFSGFKDYGRVVGMMFLKNLFIALWSLLLIIPGIIKAYAYSMSDYILRDNPGIDSLEAITRSRKMMRGWKAKLFMIDLSLIGWWFLCLFTCGIGFLWLGSYYETNHVVFYMELKGEENEEPSEEAPDEDEYIIEAAQKEIERINEETNKE